MQFTSREKRQNCLTGTRKACLYPHNLQFYKSPPTDVISLEEFEELALERLKEMKGKKDIIELCISEGLMSSRYKTACRNSKVRVLRLVERAGAKFNKNSKDYKEMIVNDLRKMKLTHYYRMTSNDLNDEIYDGRRRDHISHFILRLAYCRRDDLRRWFITQEVDLFRIRFTSEKTQLKKSFMQMNNLDYDAISEDERNSMIENLCIGFGNTLQKVKNTEYYKVPFVEVLDLVKSRRVYLKKGYAYIAEDDLVLTVLSAYRTHLSHALAMTSRALPQLEEDTRLISMLSTLHQRYIGTDYSKRRVDYSGEVVPEEIDGLSKTSFPLCMRNLHEVLRRNHHLKYNGRLQYGLFLKGIGMTLENALRFWREEFTKVMDADKFDKQYSYNIRYNYGKEGKRKNFSPFSCMKIIMSNNPGPGEFHGCPFKHSDESNLKQRLLELHISSAGINSIIDLSSKGHYQIACTRYFELTHNEATPDQGINHPNHYFEESRNVLLGKKDEKSSSHASTSSISTTPSQKSQPTTVDQSMDDIDSEPMEDIEELLRGLNGV